MDKIRRELSSFTKRAQFLELVDLWPGIHEIGKNTDIEEDIPILFMLTEFLEPKVVLELGTRQGISTRAFVKARPARGRPQVYTVDPVNCNEYLENVMCQPVVMPGEEYFKIFKGLVDLLFIDTDPHTYDQTMGWLTTWVEKKLAPGGVVLFHDVHPAREEIQVREAVEAWLATKTGWTWQVLLPERAMPVFNGGLGILWAP